MRQAEVHFNKRIIGVMFFIIVLSVTTFSFAQDRAVVIPLFDSECNCTYRTYVVEDNVIVPAGLGRNVTVYCEAGDLALSGGYRTGHDMVPGHNYPIGAENPSSWRFIFGNPRAYDVTCYYMVLCLDTAP